MSVPHVKMTAALKAAVDHLLEAPFVKDHTVRLNPLNVEELESELQAVSQWFADPGFFFERADAPGERRGTPLAVADYVLALVGCYREHIKAGNARRI
jgi:hypothetical protein